MKRKMVVVVVLFSLVCFLVGAIGLGLTFAWKPTVSAESNHTDQERAFDSTSIHQLDIYTDIADIIFVPSSSDLITVRLNGTTTDKYKPELITKQEKDKLTVEVRHPKQKGINLSLLQDWISEERDNLLTKLEVEIPDKIYADIKASSDIGSVRIADLEANQLYLSSKTGSVELSHYSGEQLEVQTDIGRVQLSEIKADMNVNSSIGKVSVDMTSVLHPINIQTEIGAVQVTVEEMTPMKVELQTSIGSIRTDLPEMTVDQQDKSNYTASFGSDGPPVKIYTEIGSITVRSR
ncbi:DUF4097 family beta strand repeat-containing protein [Paenibacillus sp. J2TS4]|uniref:DUF4097 family beta strand repeat-containing protein n=1 Tax=Paenibacillus sp. J2TS4 TaxID=2807194 RepID=UPI001B2F4F68|nr:DUF4097 family beta strand repeat-containing protein [Paenibacillus sp. J2TS4]GIP35628.1 hypothetical protein J2TS4_48380 [Paenibacillus sp. J2TS4]